MIRIHGVNGRHAHLVVGALGLDVTSLLALVADLLAASGLLRAVAGVVTRLAAVVALHAVNTFAWSQVSLAQEKKGQLGRHARDMWP